MIDWIYLAKNVAFFIGRSRLDLARSKTKEATGVSLDDQALWLIAELWGENETQAARELRMFAYRDTWPGKLTFADVCNYVKEKRVALVGNASSAMGAEHGRDIDKHDIVVRINAGIPNSVANSRDHLGESMDVWGGISTKLVSPSQAPPDPTGIAAKSSVDLGEWNSRVEQVWFVPWGPRPLHPILAPKTYGLFDEWFLAREYKGSNPSSGFAIAVMLARTEAAVTNIYGFDFFETPSLQTGRTTKFPVKQHSERLWLEEQPKIVIHPAR